MSRYERAYNTSFGGRAADDTRPNKYLPSGSERRSLDGSRLARSAPILSWSLLFPVLVLLTLSVTLRHEDSGQNFDWQVGLRLAGYTMAGLSVLLALGMRKLRIDLPIFVWALVPIGIMLTALYAPEPLLSLT